MKEFDYIEKMIKSKEILRNEAWDFLRNFKMPDITDLLV